MMPLALLGNLGPWGPMILAAIALLFFGNRLPRVMRSLRDSIRRQRSLLDSLIDEKVISQAPAWFFRVSGNRF